MIERIGSCDHILRITRQDFVQEITGLWVDADMTEGGDAVIGYPPDKRGLLRAVWDIQATGNIGFNSRSFPSSLSHFS